MGQYYIIVNIDKEEYIKPRKFGDGVKLMEFSCKDIGMTTGLSILLADGNGRGGGDLQSDSDVIGSWAGDRIVVTGDYADPEKHVPEKYREKLYKRNLKEQKARDDIDEEEAEEFAKKNCNLYNTAHQFFENISGKVLEAMLDDRYIFREIKNRLRDGHYHGKTEKFLREHICAEEI